MEAAITRFYGCSPGDQQRITNAQWLNLWYQIPRLRTEQAMHDAGVQALPHIDAEGRRKTWERWERILGEFMGRSERASTVRTSMRSMITNMRRMLRGVAGVDNV